MLCVPMGGKIKKRDMEVRIYEKIKRMYPSLGEVFWRAATAAMLEEWEVTVNGTRSNEQFMENLGHSLRNNWKYFKQFLPSEHRVANQRAGVRYENVVDSAIEAKEVASDCNSSSGNELAAFPDGFDRPTKIQTVVKKCSRCSNAEGIQPCAVLDRSSNVDGDYKPGPHYFCVACLRRYVFNALERTNALQDDGLKCMMANCEGKYAADTVEQLQLDMLENRDEPPTTPMPRLDAAVSATAPGKITERCYACRKEIVVSEDIQSHPVLVCRKCPTRSCRFCGKTWIGDEAHECINMMEDVDLDRDTEENNRHHNKFSTEEWMIKERCPMCRKEVEVMDEKVKQPKFACISKTCGFSFCRLCGAEWEGNHRLLCTVLSKTANGAPERPPPPHPVEIAAPIREERSEERQAPWKEVLVLPIKVKEPDPSDILIPHIDRMSSSPSVALSDRAFEELDKQLAAPIPRTFNCKKCKLPFTKTIENNKIRCSCKSFNCGLCGDIIDFDHFGPNKCQLNTSMPPKASCKIEESEAAKGPKLKGVATQSIAPCEYKYTESTVEDDLDGLEERLRKLQVRSQDEDRKSNGPPINKSFEENGHGGEYDPAESDLEYADALDNGFIEEPSGDREDNDREGENKTFHTVDGVCPKCGTMPFWEIPSKRWLCEACGSINCKNCKKAVGDDHFTTQAWNIERCFISEWEPGSKSQEVYPVLYTSGTDENFEELHELERRKSEEERLTEESLIPCGNCEHVHYRKPGRDGCRWECENCEAINCYKCKIAVDSDHFTYEWDNLNHMYVHNRHVPESDFIAHKVGETKDDYFEELQELERRTNVEEMQIERSLIMCSQCESRHYREPGVVENRWECENCEAINCYKCRKSVDPDHFTNKCTRCYVLYSERETIPVVDHRDEEQTNRDWTVHPIRVIDNHNNSGGKVCLRCGKQLERRTNGLNSAICECGQMSCVVCGVMIDNYGHFVSDNQCPYVDVTGELTAPMIGRRDGVFPEAPALRCCEKCCGPYEKNANFFQNRKICPWCNALNCYICGRAVVETHFTFNKRDKNRCPYHTKP